MWLIIQQKSLSNDGILRLDKNNLKICDVTLNHSMGVENICYEIENGLTNVHSMMQTQETVWQNWVLSNSPKLSWVLTSSYVNITMSVKLLRIWWNTCSIFINTFFRVQSVQLAIKHSALVWMFSSKVINYVVLSIMFT